MGTMNRYIYKTIRFSICTLLLMFSSCASAREGALHCF